MWSVECEVWSVEWRMLSVDCKGWNVWNVWSLKNVKCGVESVECGV